MKETGREVGNEEKKERKKRNKQEKPGTSQILKNNNNKIKQTRVR